MADQTTAVGRSVFLAKLLLVTIPLLHILGTINYIAHGICHPEGNCELTISIACYQTYRVLRSYVIKLHDVQAYYTHLDALTPMLFGTNN